jgi:shikimate kinase
MSTAAPSPVRRGHGLALIGYRGSGKSTVGRILADRLHRTFLDCDLELEARSGRSISGIFAERGEGAFRDLEERTLDELLAASPEAIVATGGGAVLRERNRLLLRNFGFVVWLTAEEDELARRIESHRRQSPAAERPPLTPAGTLGEIVQVLAARTPLYRDLADLIVDTAGRKPEEVAAIIMASWSQ